MVGGGCRGAEAAGREPGGPGASFCSGGGAAARGRFRPSPSPATRIACAALPSAFSSASQLSGGGPAKGETGPANGKDCRVGGSGAAGGAHCTGCDSVMVLALSRNFEARGRRGTGASSPLDCLPLSSVLSLPAGTPTIASLFSPLCSLQFCLGSPCRLDVNCRPSVACLLPRSVATCAERLLCQHLLDIGCPPFSCSPALCLVPPPPPQAARVIGLLNRWQRLACPGFGESAVRLLAAHGRAMQALALSPAPAARVAAVPAATMWHHATLPALEQAPAASRPGAGRLARSALHHELCLRRGRAVRLASDRRGREARHAAAPATAKTSAGQGCVPCPPALAANSSAAAARRPLPAPSQAHPRHAAWAAQWRHCVHGVWARRWGGSAPLPSSPWAAAALSSA